MPAQYDKPGLALSEDLLPDAQPKKFAIHGDHLHVHMSVMPHHHEAWFFGADKHCVGTCMQL